MEIKKRGRRPAKWMFVLAKLSIKNDVLTLAELSACLDVSPTAIRSFCRRQEIKGFYTIDEKEGVTQKSFRISELKKAASEYVSNY